MAKDLPLPADEEQLEELLSRPSSSTEQTLSGVQGDFLVLGAGGKMGPTLCRLLERATGRSVTAVSRFSNQEARARLESAGVRTIAADLLDRATYASLPDCPNIYYLAGMKFGASAQEDLTWAMNTYLPALVCERYPQSRIVAFSTGNVYPMVTVHGGGATEETPPAPVGEYAQSCLGRERIFEYFSRSARTPVVLIRLNYANEPRYGVIVDVATKVLSGEPVDVTMGHVNLIWQGDANNYIASALALAASPAVLLNVAGPETVAIRYLADLVAGRTGKQVTLTGSEAPEALLSNAARCFEHFGYPETTLREMVELIVRWLAKGGAVLGKPTKFQVRDGRF